MALLLSGPAYFFELPANSDGNIRWLFNYLFAFRPHDLSEIAFSQGPLAFLQYPLPIGQNLTIAIFFGYFIRAILLVSLFCLKNPNEGVFPVILVFLLLVMLAGDILLPLITLLAVIGASAFHSRKWTVVALVLAWLIWQIRLVPGILAFALVATHLILKLWLDADRRKFYALMLLAFALGYLLIDGIVQGGIYELYQHYFNLASLVGVGTIPSLKDPFPWHFSVAFFLVQLTFLWWTPQNLRWWTLNYLLVVTLAFLYFNERPANGSYLVLVKLAFGAILLILWKVKDKTKLVLAGASLTLMLFYFGKAHLQIDSFNFSRLKPALSLRQLVDQDYDRKLYQNSLLTHKSSLSPTGNFDVYPWHYLPFAGHFNKMRPSPLIQAYIGNNPRLDSLHRAHFSGKEAPKSVFIHLPNPEENGLPKMALLGQYLMNAEPLTVRKILTSYNPLGLTEDGFHEHRIKPEASAFQEQGLLKLDINEWQPVPLDQSFYNYGIPIGAVPSLDSVVYRLQSGEEMAFKLNPANLKSGLYLGPYISDQSLSRNEKVIALKVISRSKARPSEISFEVWQLPLP